MASFANFVEFVMTGNVWFLIVDQAMTLACLVIWYQLRPLFVLDEEVR